MITFKSKLLQQVMTINRKQCVKLKQAAQFPTACKQQTHNHIIKCGKRFIMLTLHSEITW